MKLSHLVSGACGLALLIAGCATISSWRGIEKPTVSVRNVRITGLDFEAAQLAYDLVISNPNSVAVTFDGFDYDLQIEKTSLLRGMQTNRVNIAMNSQSRVTVPVSLGYQQVLDTVQSLSGKDDFSYALLGDVLLDVPLLGITKIPLEHAGTLPIVRLPTLDIENCAVKSLNLTGAKIDLTVRVHNPNAFALSLADMAYAFDVSGKRWAEGTTAGTLALPVKGDGSVTIPINVNFLSVGSSAYEALTSTKPVPYTLQAKADVATSMKEFKRLRLPLQRTGELRWR
ncbi:MAG: LEA type 2 family protein [bacterium]|nr:LEA type 2 family protein [bacterium]